VQLIGVPSSVKKAELHAILFLKLKLAGFLFVFGEDAPPAPLRSPGKSKAMFLPITSAKFSLLPVCQVIIASGTITSIWSCK